MNKNFLNNQNYVLGENIKKNVFLKNIYSNNFFINGKKDNTKYMDELRFLFRLSSNIYLFILFLEKKIKINKIFILIFLNGLVFIFSVYILTLSPSDILNTIIQMLLGLLIVYNIYFYRILINFKKIKSNIFLINIKNQECKIGKKIFKLKIKNEI